MQIFERYVLHHYSLVVILYNVIIKYTQLKSGYSMKQSTRFLAYEHLQQLIHAVIDHGYSCMGPQMRDGTIIYDSLTSVDELPLGINIEQSPGHYSVKSTRSTHYFDWANGPQAIKPLLFTPANNSGKAQNQPVVKLVSRQLSPIKRHWQSSRLEPVISQQ